MIKIKFLIKKICPPIIYDTLSRVKKIFFPVKRKLFDGDDSLFIKEIKKCNVFGEYGVGTSTIWVSNNFPKKKIYSVDSSEYWIKQTKKKCKKNLNLKFYHAKVGTVGTNGRPIDYKNINKFNNYANWLWKQSAKPDLVLIDGRFRVYCFLICLIHCKNGTKILFDDYRDKKHYHFVEKYIKPANYCGRQALFVVKNKKKINLQKCKRDSNLFKCVFE